jgi:hypothetical protein
MKPIFELSAKDKTRASHGFGFSFHHTEPQRHVPCLKGTMLAPASADDIPPITAEAMASVQAALTLLANLLADRDHSLYLADDRHKMWQEKAREVLLVGEGLKAILRVETK